MLVSGIVSIQTSPTAESESQREWIQEILKLTIELYMCAKFGLCSITCIVYFKCHVLSLLWYIVKSVNTIIKQKVSFRGVKHVSNSGPQPMSSETKNRIAHQLLLWNEFIYCYLPESMAHNIKVGENSKNIF